MEAKLAEFRKRQQTVPTHKGKTAAKEKASIGAFTTHQGETSTCNSTSEASSNEHSQGRSKNSWIILLLKGLLWAIVWALTIELECGAIYFIISLLGLVYFNTRSGTKKEDSGPSAYSVFNPDFERIDGTFTSDQFERQLGVAHQ